MNMHEQIFSLGMNMAWTVHEVTMILGIKSMKYGPKFPNFMGVARENLLCFEHEHGHVHAKEQWTIFRLTPWWIKNLLFIILLLRKWNIKYFEARLSSPLVRHTTG